MTRMDMSPSIPRRLRLLLLLAVSALLLLAVLVAAARRDAPTGVALAAAAIALAMGWRQVERLAGADGRARSALLRSVRDSQTLLQMTGLFQRCRGATEIEAAVASSATRLLPGCSGMLHILPRAADPAPRTSCWGAPSPGCRGGFQPGRCAALQQGRMQINVAGLSGACPLAPKGTDTLCMPVAAEGATQASVTHAVLQFAGPALPRGVQAQRLALAMAEAAGFALENLAIRESLRGQALRDPLTGLHNRRFLDEVSDTLAHQAVRRGVPLAIAVLDLDHFKQLNDQHGHAVGDAVLRDLGALLAASLRRADIACRHGGEEFVIVLPDCDAVQAWGLMDTLRRRIVARRLGSTTGHRVTCSIGVSALTEGGSIADAIAEADAALYAAKRSGRNRVVLASRIVAAAAPAAA